MSLAPRKTHGDSVLGQLTPERQKTLFEFVETHTLEQAREHLLLDGIDLSMKTIGKWAARRRKEAYDLAFASHLIEIAAATERSQQMMEEIGNTDLVDEKNLTLLSSAYHNALLLRDKASIEFLGSAYTGMLGAVSTRQRARAATMNAETSREALKLKITAAIDTGLDALFAEVQAIPEAAELLSKIRSLVKAKVEEAA